MKTNFLCRHVLPRGAGVFLKFGLPVMILTLFCLSGYAQTSSTTGERQHLYLKFYKNHEAIQDHINVKPLSDDNSKKFSYGYYNNVDTETATLRLFEDDDLVAPDEGTGFHAQLKLMSDVPSLFIRFGVSMGNFKRTYSINNEKLYYNRGHIDVFPETRIDVYYDGSLYQVHYNDVQIECEEVDASGLRETFVSSYGRTNTGGEVHLSFAPYVGVLDACRLPVLKCEDANLDDCNFVYLDCEATGGIGCYIPFTPVENCSAIEPTECGENADNKLPAQQLHDFIVHPNPAENQLTITLTTLVDETIKINMVDAIGRLVSYQAHDGLAGNTNTIDFDITNLNSGLYYIKIDSEYRFETKKVIVIK